MKPRLLIIGGFLGAGKTTLLWELARHFAESNIKVGLVTNDQASGLVDTSFLEQSNNTVLEVSGSCFCCNFNGFIDAVAQAVEVEHCQLVLAEPVGSCTDLSATILQPLKDKFSQRFEIAPLTVLVEPNKLMDILKGGTAGLHDSAAYILQKQLEEADIILISKSDLLSQQEQQDIAAKAGAKWPFAKVMNISVVTGQGLDMWLDYAMTKQHAGMHLVSVDYDTYAEGEAVLGWLNARFACEGMNVDWDEVLERTIARLGMLFDRQHIAVGHVKAFVKSESGYAVANLTGTSETIAVRKGAGKGNKAEMIVNARVEMTPEKLNILVLEILSEIFGDGISWRTLESNCLSPGRPNPTHRYSEVIEKRS